MQSLACWLNWFCWYDLKCLCQFIHYVMLHVSSNVEQCLSLHIDAFWCCMMSMILFSLTEILKFWPASSGRFLFTATVSLKLWAFFILWILSVFICNDCRYCKLFINVFWFWKLISIQLCMMQVREFRIIIVIVCLCNVYAPQQKGYFEISFENNFKYAILTVVLV